MQIRSHRLSRLRQKLTRLYHPPLHPLAHFLDGYPLARGTLYTLRRKCAKPSCRCARGRRHETLVLTATISGKTRLWTIPADRSEEFRQLTEHYRQFRKARSDFLKDCAQHQAQMLRLIDGIEKLRRVEP